MVTLCYFDTRDIPLLRAAIFPNVSEDEIKQTLNKWDTHLYGGKHFEMFAVCAENTVVGYVALYQHNGYIISAGPEIFPQYRRKGYVTAALERLYAIARNGHNEEKRVYGCHGTDTERECCQYQTARSIGIYFGLRNIQ